MKRLQRQLKKTVVFVTHDIDEAVLLSDKIALLKGGVLQQYAAPEKLWKEPANEFVSDFFGDDFGLRIMVRHGLAEIPLEPLGEGDENLPTIAMEATLKEALAELIDKRAERIVVRDGDVAAGTVAFTTLMCALGQER